MAGSSLQRATSYRGSFCITGVDVPDENKSGSALKLFCDLEGGGECMHWKLAHIRDLDVWTLHKTEECTYLHDAKCSSHNKYLRHA